MATEALKITCDVGGTFTDVVISERTGRLSVGKSLTTPPHLIVGLLTAIENATSHLELGVAEALEACTLFVYSTTQATNAILEGTTSRTALLVTEGFPDILVRREGGSMHPYDMTRPYPDPYIPRRLTFEVPERVDAEGQLVRVLDEPRLGEIIGHLRRLEVEAVAVCLLWSTVNPVHEKRVGEMLAEQLADTPVTLSHQLNPIVREYRRASGTAIDASLKQLMQGHLAEVEAGLRAEGFDGELLAATSLGGALPMRDLIERPILAAKSGPSLAPVAGQLFCDELSVPDAIVCDTGGTSFDLSLIRDNKLVTTRETWLGGLFTGHLTGLSSVDVRSIGAGGGSIAWLDAGGLLRVGPQSAGASPGPACYGNGGDRPTMTDAALLLGYLDPEQFLGGRMQLDVAAAEAAVDSLAEVLGQSRISVAEAIVTVANEHMVNAIKESTINQGIDPRKSLIVAGGGAAGLGIAAIASELGCTRVAIPRAAGALSAFGGQYSDIVIEQGRGAHTHTNRFDFDVVNAALAEIDETLQPFADSLRSSGVTDQRIERVVEARYAHQVWSLDVPIDVERFRDADDVAAFEAAFHAIHERVFAVSEPGQPVELVHCSSRLIAAPAKPPRNTQRERKTGDAVPLQRRAHFRQIGEVDLAVHRGSDLTPGDIVDGAALIIEATTTIVVPPAWRVTVTSSDDYLLELM